MKTIKNVIRIDLVRSIEGERQYRIVVGTGDDPDTRKNLETMTVSAEDYDFVVFDGEMVLCLKSTTEIIVKETL